jgi:hypothetical protein
MISLSLSLSVLSLSFPGAMGSEVLLYHMLWAMMYCFLKGPKTMVLSDPGLNTL